MLRSSKHAHEDVDILLKSEDIDIMIGSITNKKSGTSLNQFFFFTKKKKK